MLLVHWGIEHFWRGRGNGFIKQCRALVGIWQYFRLVKQHKIQFVWVVHDLQHHEGPGLVDRIGYRILANAADICVLHSQSARNAFVARYPLARNKCLVLDMGNYDSVYLKTLNRDTTRKQLVTQSGRRILIACGMIRPYKGLETAVAAMQHLPAEYHLVIAGPPLIPSYVEELRAQIGNRDSVTFLPRPLDEQEFADLHEVADCVLLPYHKITGSAALLAACTLSRGVVATDLPYFRDLLALEPDAGILVPPGDPAKLAEGIQEYFTKSVEVRHAASRRIADRYPWDSVLLPLVEKLRLNARVNHAITSTL